MGQNDVTPKIPKNVFSISCFSRHDLTVDRLTRKLLLLLCTPALLCTPPRVTTSTPDLFNYSTIATKHVAYGRPIVTSSEIYYENRFTNQSYHSIDKSRTQDAFSRDFAQIVQKSRLGWQALNPAVDSQLHARYAYVNDTIDSLPSDTRGRLAADSIDVVVLVYAMRLYHFQSVGLRPGKTGTVNSYGTIFNKKLEYLCSIIDVSENRALWSAAVKQEEDSPALTLVENGAKKLFGMLLRDRGGRLKRGP
jgi:hypothetical protein